MMAAPAAAFAETPQERTLWQGTPSPLLLAGHVVGILAVVLAAVALTFFQRASTDAGTETRDFISFVWILAVIFVVVWLLVLVVAWIRIRSTHYTLTTQRVLIEQGIFTKTLNEIDLRYIDDSLFVQSFVERLLGIGHVTLLSSDKTTPQYVLRAIAAPRAVRETIRAEAYKASQRQLFTRET